MCNIISFLLQSVFQSQSPLSISLIFSFSVCLFTHFSLSLSECMCLSFVLSLSLSIYLSNYVCIHYMFLSIFSLFCIFQLSIYSSFSSIQISYLLALVSVLVGWINFFETRSLLLFCPVCVLLEASGAWEVKLEIMTDRRRTNGQCGS